MASPHNATNYVLMIAEMRRYPQMSYKSDIVVLSGLDSGDRKALDAKFKPTDAPPCQFDKEDLRFVLKGPHFAPMEILNCLAQERGYKVEYNPQQHGIPLKQGATDDKFALIYQLTKPVVKKPTAQTSSPDGGTKVAAKDKKPSEDGSGTGGGSGSTSTTNISSATQDLSCKSGKAPLAVGDMLISLPETTARDQTPDITSDTRHVDSRVPPSSDYYA